MYMYPALKWKSIMTSLTTTSKNIFSIISPQHKVKIYTRPTLLDEAKNWILKKQVEKQLVTIQIKFTMCAIRKENKKLIRYIERKTKKRREDLGTMGEAQKIGRFEEIEAPIW